MRRLLVLTALVVATDALELHWYESIQKTGVVCNDAECRAFVHLVFVATPTDVTNVLEGTGEYSLDGAIQTETAAMFERHLVKGVCTGDDCVDYGPSQMWNWGFDLQFGADEDAPDELCVNVTVEDPAAGDSESLPEVCVLFGAKQTVIDNTEGSVLVSFDDSGFSSAATVICSNSSDACRTNIHIVFSGACADIVQIMDTGGTYSLDGGATWFDDGFATYEQHIDADDGGTFYQAMQYDVDVFQDKSAAAVSTSNQACVKVWVNDTTTGEVAWVTNGNYCMDVCTTLADFHDSDGYCTTP